MVITGGSSGIGRAIAVRAAAAGCRVLVLDVRSTPQEGGLPTVEAAPGAVYFEGSVTSAADVERACAAAVAQWGRLDCWVNNAAIDLTDPPHNREGGLLAVSEAEWDRVHATNTRGYFLGAKVAVAQFLRQEPSPTTGLRGKLINISSQHGMIACPGNIAYGTSKAAAVYMTKQIAVDFAPHAVTCNAVAPGKIVVDPTRQIKQYSRSRTPCPRLGTPGDVASAVCWLAGDEAGAFVNGHNLMVDGGWMAY